MAAFAFAATHAFGHLGAAVALVIAAGAWVVTALMLYAILWFR
jgi:hypothetical protein